MVDNLTAARDPLAKVLAYYRLILSCSKPTKQIDCVSNYIVNIYLFSHMHSARPTSPLFYSALRALKGNNANTLDRDPVVSSDVTPRMYAARQAYLAYLSLAVNCTDDLSFVQVLLCMCPCEALGPISIPLCDSVACVHFVIVGHRLPRSVIYHGAWSRDSNTLIFLKCQYRLA